MYLRRVERGQRGEGDKRVTGKRCGRGRKETVTIASSFKRKAFTCRCTWARKAEAACRTDLQDVVNSDGDSGSFGSQVPPHIFCCLNEFITKNYEKMMCKMN